MRLQEVPPGPKTFYVQMMIMPGTEDARREFKNIQFKIVSACEYAIGGGLCILPQPSEDAGRGGERLAVEEKKLGITMCGEGQEWQTCTGAACEQGATTKWPKSEDQCCQETCVAGETRWSAGANCAQCECDPTKDQCTFNEMRAGSLGLSAFSSGRMMCSGGKAVMPKCKPPPKTNMCMPKIEYTATFESVSWACPASKLQPATGPCVPCTDAFQVADVYQETCVDLRTSGSSGTSSLDANDMSLFEETAGAASSSRTGTTELRSVGELASSVQRSHQVTNVFTDVDELQPKSRPVLLCASLILTLLHCLENVGV
jgi:hypothetical protein